MLPRPHALTMQSSVLVGSVVVAVILGLYLNFVHGGLFNNYFSYTAAISAHEDSWKQVFGKSIPASRLDAVVKDYGGSCKAGVRSYTLHRISRQSEGGVYFCTVVRSGAFPIFFVAHKWDCAFNPGLGQRLSLIGCQRQSLSF